MAISIKAILSCLLLAGASGCFTPTGYLFTKTIVPYEMPNGRARTVGTKSCSVDITQIKEPFSRLNLSVIWTNRAVAESLRRADMNEVRYVDLQTLSILNKVYERRRLVFYGE